MMEDTCWLAVPKRNGPNGRIMPEARRSLPPERLGASGDHGTTQPCVDVPLRRNEDCPRRPNPWEAVASEVIMIVTETVRKQSFLVECMPFASNMMLGPVAQPYARLHPTISNSYLPISIRN